jgi:His/Glu/Gln/Arg/opine family amino acid ABC transporter permease subunit
VLALMKMTEVRKGKKTLFSVIANIYIDIIRGTPTVVQLLIIYFLVFQTQMGIVAGIVTFGINSSAYVAEIIRAGIMAVDNGQMEAGRSLGLSYSQTMKDIIIPQAVKNILPALGNEFIVLIKETAILGYVSIQDLTKASDFVMSRTYTLFMPLIGCAVIYYLLVKLLTLVLNAFERRLRQSDIR